MAVAALVEHKAFRCPLWDNARSAADLLRVTPSKNLPPVAGSDGLSDATLPDEPIVAPSPAERYACRANGVRYDDSGVRHHCHRGGAHLRFRQRVARLGELHCDGGRNPGTVTTGRCAVGSFNFVAFLVFGTFVAKTIGGDLIRISAIEKEWQVLTLLCALIGATLWDVITWRYGLPSSSSHALIGGYAGSAIAAHHGVQGLLIAEGWIKTVAFIFISQSWASFLGAR